MYRAVEREERAKREAKDADKEMRRMQQAAAAAAAAAEKLAAAAAEKAAVAGAASAASSNKADATANVVTAPVTVKFGLGATAAARSFSSNLLPSHLNHHHFLAPSCALTPALLADPRSLAPPRHAAVDSVLLQE